MITEAAVDWNWHGFKRHCHSVINFFGFWFLEWQTSAMGQKQTSRALAIYVRFWGLSRHSMSAFES